MTSFLQTEKWAEFQKALGAEYFNIDDVLVIKYRLAFGKHYLYIPRANASIEKLKEVIGKVRVRSSVFLRIEPETENSNSEFIIDLHKIGFRKINQESQPSRTLILDIARPEKELLADMHQKTRYNIGLAKKKGIEIEIKDSLSEKEFERFWDLIKKTAKRDRFSSFSKEYYEKLLKIFRTSDRTSYGTSQNVKDKAPHIKVFLAKYEGKIIAAVIIMFYDKTAIYLHGASDYEYRNFMAPHLLQWKAIIEAKKIGMNFYDFWGIDDKKWPGLTRFKMGFGGREVEYVGTYDFVFRPEWYWGYRIFKKVKKYWV